VDFNVSNSPSSKFMSATILETLWSYLILDVYYHKKQQDENPYTIKDRLPFRLPRPVLQ
jgi:hypothetical protein